MIVMATDLPLSGRLLGRLARRAAFGLARTGASGAHDSGDYIIAFSTTYRLSGSLPRIREALALDEGVIDPAFRAAADATEEAILNSLFRAERIIGRDGNTREELSLDRVVELIKMR